MSNLQKAVENYVEMRRALGYKLSDAGNLPRIGYRAQALSAPASSEAALSDPNLHEKRRAVREIHTALRSPLPQGLRGTARLVGW